MSVTIIEGTPAPDSTITPGSVGSPTTGTVDTGATTPASGGGGLTGTAPVAAGPAATTTGAAATSTSGSASTVTNTAPAADQGNQGNPSMGFVQRLINVQFNLANGQFAGGGNQANISNLRTSAIIVNSGGASNSTLELTIYGLPLTLMNQLSTVGRDYLRSNNNGVSVFAGDAKNGMALVFTGRIVSAYVDAKAMPQVCFRVTAWPGGHWIVKPAKVISQAGAADAAQMMKGLAQQMGYSFENAGVTTKLSNPYYAGTVWQQAIEIARHARFNMAVDRGTMAIVPPEKTRQGSAVLISPQTGMVGYPAFNQNDVIVESLYIPAVKLMGPIQVQSDLSSACGMWKVNRLVYELDSMVPHGKWFQTMNANIIGPTPP